MLSAVFAVIFIATLLTFLFTSSMRKGPWGNWWTFFSIVALVIFCFVVWIPPVGPVWFGVAWLDLLVIGFLTSLFLVLATPSTPAPRTADPQTDTRKVDAVVSTVGIVFWMILAILVIALVVGIAQTMTASAQRFL